MMPRDRLALWMRGTVVVLVYAAALVLTPLLIMALSQWITIPEVGWFHYVPGEQAPPFAQQFHQWFLDTYNTIRLDLDDRARAALVFITVLAGSWLALVWISLSTLWCLALDGADALRERAAHWGPRGWIASLLTTLVLSGTASPAHATTTARPVATAPQHPHDTRSGGNSRAWATDSPATPGDHTQPPPREPGVHLPADIRPDCPRVRVHRGDTLSRIAERELGTIARWHDLARVNRFQLGPNPEHLEPGWEILLPPEAAPPKQGPTKVVTVARGDTLWSLSERELGTPNRWGELWNLNLRRTQHDGLQLSLPDRLQPGWQIVVPDEPHNKPAPGFTPTAPVPSQDPFTIDPWPDPFPPPVSSSEPPVRPAPPSESPPQEEQGHPHAPPPPPQTTKAPSLEPQRHTPDRVGVDTLSGGYLSLGMAALVTLAVVTVRLYRRRHYHPGHRGKPDPGAAPVVRALRLTPDTRAPEEAGGEDEDIDWAPLPNLETQSRAYTAARSTQPEREQTLLGEHDGQPLVLNLAATRGLGLTGPGAIPAARALLLTSLGHNPSEADSILVPRTDARRLVGPGLPTELPPCLRVIEDTATLIHTLENTAQHGKRVTVIATPNPELHAHLASLLTERAGIHAILLGAWEHGDTIHVCSDGAVSTTASTTGTQLSGARLFHLPRSDATELLKLLTTAHHVQRPEQPPPALTGVTDPPGTHEFVLDHHDAADHDEPEHLTLDAIAEVPAASTETEQPHSQHDRLHARRPDPHTDRPSEHSSDPSETTQTAPLHLQVLGRLHLTLTATDRDLIDDISPRQREILVYLALHPRGVRRDTLTAELWPDHPKPTNSFHATLSQLRSTLKTATSGTITSLICSDDGHYRLDPTVVTVDLWPLHQALTTARTHHNTTTNRIAALRRASALYDGDLAATLPTNGWLDPPRESLRRDILDAYSDLIRLTGDNNPEQRRALLERARTLDPYNEPLYRDLMRTHAQLGQHDAIPRTLNLLTHTLAELDQHPTTETQHLAHTLTHHEPPTPE